ncbi:hypothetical protein L1987_60690 [Smallanthus sonchifolius]|uniref:Uncharacterized protein n=1 Tax=Smallanthus sonchifolius TaxID=185202 RepID=A0ACB9D8P4_9ASTR|nr:hypothetical protein L1987_60690 [Smallanthus sonchifolius]
MDLSHFRRIAFRSCFINYADKRLQQHFIRHLCKLEQEDTTVLYEWIHPNRKNPVVCICCDMFTSTQKLRLLHYLEPGLQI